MQKSLSWRMCAFFVLLLGLCAVVYIYHSRTVSVPSDSYFRMSFLDVGQGDAILIETPDDVQVLIDGGRDATVVRALAQELPWTDRTLDMVVATHPDLDHIGGLPDILDRYEVSAIMQTTNDHTTDATEALLRAKEREEAIAYTATAGAVYRLGASTTITVYSPAGDPTHWESNNSSIVTMVTYGDTRFMLTGDAGSGIESYLVSQHGIALQSDVLKLGHHGSKTSSAADFLAAVAPRFAVVSAAKNNSYGHPHAEVLMRVEEYTDARVVSTADAGTITFVSDGTTVWIE